MANRPAAGVERAAEVELAAARQVRPPGGGERVSLVPPKVPANSGSRGSVALPAWMRSGRQQAIHGAAAVLIGRVDVALRGRQPGVPQEPHDHLGARSPVHHP